MYVIAGLGNPGRGYKHTRHNLGFMVIERLAKANKVSLIRRKFRSKFGQGHIAGEPALFLMPQTYMNLSGYAVSSFLKYYKVAAERLIVICDDTALPAGKMRIREKGGAGGHNGLKNIIYELDTDAFIRVRIGVGQKPEEMDLAAYVLSKTTEKERIIFEEAASRAALAVTAIIKDGIGQAMNVYNA